jgi:hypothetical protein
VIIDLRTQSVFDIVGVLGVWVFGCLGVWVCCAVKRWVCWVFGCIGCLGLVFFGFFFSTTKLRRPWYEFFFRSNVRR